jgi:hypothetical protein
VQPEYFQSHIVSRKWAIKQNNVDITGTRENTPEIIVAFQIGLTLKIVFINKNTLRM